jgi:hypothetical protein
LWVYRGWPMLEWSSFLGMTTGHLLLLLLATGASNALEDK